VDIQLPNSNPKNASLCSIGGYLISRFKNYIVREMLISVSETLLRIINSKYLLKIEIFDFFK